MKKGIHPEYHNKVTVTCSCGNTFETGSTTAELKVEVCSACHPFYTGQSKIVDTAGRVDRFKERLKKKTDKVEVKKKTEKKSDKEQPGKQKEVKIN